MNTSASPTASLSRQAVTELITTQERFNRSTNKLTESLAHFRPAEGTMMTAQQVAHAAQVIDWLIEGAFRNEGFDMNFEKQIKQVMAVESLAAARAWFEKPWFSLSPP